ncbi:hypothetical protein K1719_021894 [Acacia pycnantha]|nr:hypothetical protein K1719_021894 [Acacia pycnantha]
MDDNSPSSAVRCSFKRKLEPQEGADQPTACPKLLVLEPQKSHQHLQSEAVLQVTILNSSLSSSQSDRLAAKSAVLALFNLFENEVVRNNLVNWGAVPALLRHMKAPEPVREGDGVPKPCEHDVEEKCVHLLGFLATVKSENEQLIVDAGALPCLVDLLKRHKNCGNSRKLVRRLVTAILYLAYQDDNIQNRVRMEGGIPLLVELLEFDDAKVQRKAVLVLHCLTRGNDENKNEVFRCNALPTLLLMLGSGDNAIQYEAVGVIGNLVQCSPNIQREILSRCPNYSKGQAAFLIGVFAATDSDSRVHIAQRGAIQPLIVMLKFPNAFVQRMSSFALAMLSKDTNNQAGIVLNGGIEPLFNLLCVNNDSIQRDASFILECLAMNEDNVVDIVKADGVQKLVDLVDLDFIVQDDRFLVCQDLLMESLLFGENAWTSAKTTIVSHAFWRKDCSKTCGFGSCLFMCPDNRKFIFVDNNGLEFLLDLLGSTNLGEKHEASMALHSLAVRTTSVPPVDAAPPSPNPQVCLGEQYVNNPALSDITFLVEGKRFYAHRSCLVASSDVFQAMFEGDYRESEAKDIPIPNIKWDVFELMMRFIYTGNVDVNSDIVQDLLRAADQYLLEGLKRLCENEIAQDVSVENVSDMYELSKSFNYVSLRQACILFLLEQFGRLCAKPWYSHLTCRIILDTRNFFRSLLTMPTKAES